MFLCLFVSLCIFFAFIYNFSVYFRTCVFTRKNIKAQIRKRIDVNSQRKLGTVASVTRLGYF